MSRVPWNFGGGVAQVLHHIAAQVVADQIRIPVGRGQQPLHPIGGPPRCARPAASCSCDPRCPAARAGTPAPAGVARRGRTVPRCGRVGVQPRRPCLDLLEVCGLVGLRYDPSPLYSPVGLPAHPNRRAGTLPHLVPSAAGVLGLPEAQPHPDGPRRAVLSVQMPLEGADERVRAERVHEQEG
jgi:hypothetical protein